MGNVGSEYGYWLLEGNECSAVGGSPSNPILSGSAPNSHCVGDVVSQITVFSSSAGVSPCISLKIKKRHYEHYIIETHR